MQAKHGAQVFGIAKLELAQAAESHDPAKHFLDSTAGIDRLVIPPVPGGTAIDR